MAAPTQALFLLHKANNLPKADTFGKIDAYAKITVKTDDAGEKSTKTGTVTKNFNPVWNHHFPHLGTASKYIITIYDYDKLSADDKVATVTIDAKKVQWPSVLQTYDLQLEKGYKSKGGKPTITVSLGWVYSFGGMRGLNMPGAQFAPGMKEQTMYLPIKHPSMPGLIAKIEWEKGERVDVHILETQNTYSQGKLLELYLNVAGADYFDYKVRRQTHKNPVRVGMYNVFAETKIDDIPLYARFDSITVNTCDVSSVWQGTMGELTKRYGWKGVLSYDKAKKQLSGNLKFDDKSKTVHFMEQHFCLSNDWDSKDADIGVSLYKSAAEQGFIVDICHVNKPKRKVKYYPAGKTIAGEVPVVSKVSVDDMPYPVMLKDLMIRVFKRNNGATFRLIDYIPFYGPRR